MPNQVDQLNAISEQISRLEINKNSVSTGSFWAGIILTIISMVAIASLTFGNLQKDFENHKDNLSIHLSEEIKQQITLNTKHTEVYTRENLDNLYVSHEEATSLIDEEIKQNKDHDNN